jgi:quercetin dioxygenase-like cupin family protein
MAKVVGDLVGAADIPPDGTLSRVAANEGSVRVVVFAFDQGQELTEHTASVPVIIQVLTGSLTVTVGGESHRMTPSSWMYLDPREPHSVFAEEPSRMLLTMVRGG